MTGQPCERCDHGHLRVYRSVRTSDGAMQKQFFGCWLCGWKPERNTVVVAARPPNRKRVTKSSANVPMIVSTAPGHETTITKG